MTVKGSYSNYRVGIPVLLNYEWGASVSPQASNSADQSPEQAQQAPRVTTKGRLRVLGVQVFGHQHEAAPPKKREKILERRQKQVAKYENRNPTKFFVPLVAFQKILPYKKTVVTENGQVEAVSSRALVRRVGVPAAVFPILGSFKKVTEV